MTKVELQERGKALGLNLPDEMTNADMEKAISDADMGKAILDAELIGTGDKAAIAEANARAAAAEEKAEKAEAEKNAAIAKAEIEKQAILANKTKFMNNAREETLKILEAEEKVPLFIPSDPLNPGMKQFKIWINGVQYKLNREQDLKVPKSVYEVYMRSITGTAKALSKVKMEEIGSE